MSHNHPSPRGLDGIDPATLIDLTEACSASDPERAYKLAQEAYTLAETLADMGAFARGWQIIGAYHLKKGDFKPAREALLRALPASQSAAEDALQIDLLRDLLKTSFFLGDYEAALEYGATALERCRERGNRGREAKLLNAIGVVYGNLNAYQEALENFLASLALLEAEGAALGHPLNNLGNIYLELDDDARALTFFEDARAAFQKTREEHGEATALGNLGRVYTRLAQHERAVAVLEASLDIFGRLGDRTYLAPAHTKLGDAYAGAGEAEKAFAHYQQSLALFKDAPGAFLDETLSSLGELYLAQGCLEQARTCLVRALTLVEAEHRTQRQYEIHQTLARVHEELGDTAGALEHFRAFHTLKERVSSETSSKRLRALMIQFEVERVRSERELYRLEHVQLSAAYDELKTLHERLEAQNRVLEGLSSRDSLTGLYNRRYLSSKLADEFARARRYHHPLSVMICDIDAFKSINDSFSHAKGDEVLGRVARLLEGATREVDTVARYGGEEFVVIFSETSLASAVAVCEKLRRAVEAHPWHELHPDLRVTLSIGLSSDLTLLDHEQLLNVADSKCYEAKRQGKNRVCY